MNKAYTKYIKIYESALPQHPSLISFVFWQCRDSSRGFSLSAAAFWTHPEGFLGPLHFWHSFFIDFGFVHFWYFFD